MSGDLLIFIELLLVFGVAFGWGLNELRQLRKYKQKPPPGGKEDHDKDE